MNNADIIPYHVAMARVSIKALQNEALFICCICVSIVALSILKRNIIYSLPLSEESEL